MGTNSSFAGTHHVRLLANKALETNAGISVECESKQEAQRLRQVFNGMRFKDRQDAKKIFSDENHPKHGVSVYDKLETSIRKEGDKWVLTFQDVVKGLAGLTIIDKDTGKPINIEDL